MSESLQETGFLNDVRLSWKARGLMAFILTRPAGTPLSIHLFVESGTSGRDQVYTILRELELAGYIRRTQGRDMGGKVSGIIYEIIPQPDEIGFTQFVYILEADGLYKIGYTNNLAGRIRRITIQTDAPVRIVHIIETDDMVALESLLHRRFADKRVQGEWFRLTPMDINQLKTYQRVTKEEIDDDR